MAVRRVARWTGWIVAVALGLPLVLALGLGWAANTGPGRAWIERAVPGLSGGAVALAGLDGRFPDALRVDRLELRDAAGPWLVAEHLALDWSPGRLLSGTAVIQRLQAERVAVARRPLPASRPPPAAAPSLPVRVAVGALRVGRLELAPAVIGAAGVFALDGKAGLAALDRIDAELAARRLDGEGAYRAELRIEGATLRAGLNLTEPARGWLAALAKLPDLGPLSLDATLDGPRTAAGVRLALAAGPLRANAQGHLDLVERAADVDVTATAPAMRPRPDLGWESLVLQAKLRGPLARMAPHADLRIDHLEAGGARIPKTLATVDGDAGRLRLHGEFERIALPGPKPDLLRAAPLRFQADIRLDMPERPVGFAIHHPLLDIEGRATTAPGPVGHLAAKFPDLAPWAAVGGLDIRGRGGLGLGFAVQGGATRLDLDGGLAVAGGKAPLPALVGEAAKFDARAVLRGPDIALDHLRFKGKALAFTAKGAVARNVPDLDWTLELADVAAVAPTWSGRVGAEGRFTGTPDDLAIRADLRGELAPRGSPRQALTAEVRLEGLPRAPVGHVVAEGQLAGAPLRLGVEARREATGGYRIALERADWKSAHGAGAVTLRREVPWPVGSLELRMARLDDLQVLLGRPLTGDIAATLEATPQAMHLRLAGQDIGLPGAKAGRATLVLALAGPPAHPVVDGSLSLEEIATGSLSGSVRLDADGPLSALALRLTATGRDPAGAEAGMNGAALFDLPARHAELSALETRWKNRPLLRLLEPARIGYGGGASVDRLRLGLGKAVLSVAGRAGPTLALEVDLDGSAADLAPLLPPGPALDGTFKAEARLGGTPNRPLGTVALEVAGLQARDGPGRALPPVRLNAKAGLDGDTAQLDTRLEAGPTTALTVAGRAPLVPSGEFALHGGGGLDLKLLDPLLIAQGQRAHGRIALNIDLAGTPAAPRATGTVRLADGEFQDYAEGVNIDHIQAEARIEGDTFHLDRCEGRAGPGGFTLAGSLGLLARDRPVDLKLTAHKARPVSSDRLTLDLNADIALRGQAPDALTASGRLNIQRAEIAIPERLPAGIAVLDVRRPGAPPPAPPRPGPAVALDIAIEAPGRLFVRGRGVDAELGGKIQLRGTTANPQPDGNFELRRGQFTLAGQSLVFGKGVVGFNGGSLVDPSLDFTATSTGNNITATLNVGGSVRKPKIGLSSVPELPPDEVLSQLLFGHGTVSLSPFEMAQIATAVASLTGITAGMDVGDPLGGARKFLGLDRLALGSVGGGGRGGAPALEAGRYITPGVYVGAKQGVTGAGTQATVRIDLFKGLKLEGSVGTGAAAATAPGTSPGVNAGTNSVGVIYQFEY